jgi:hypothetical protein
MSKHRCVLCPGCGYPFSEGRSLSQHFVWHPACKAISTQLNVAAPATQELCTSGLANVATTSNVKDPLDDSLSQDSQDPESVDFPIDCESATETNTPFIGPPEVLADANLQSVVAFPVAFTNAALHEVELLKLLHKIGAPNHAFESLMAWGRAASDHNYHFRPSPQRYESQLRNLTQLVGMTPCRPTIAQVSLEPDNLQLDVVVFPFATMLASLLNCPMLNKMENLVVNPTDRYGRYHSPDGRLGDVNSGQWYQDTYDKVITDPTKDFLCPIIFAMDKTVISEISHLSVHVILFTTTIFNREVRVIITLLCLLMFVSLTCMIPSF